jgi:pimeloyl-ACP methyl ester carboxylesterase
MYALKDFGSFHVGGRTVEVSGQPTETLWFSATMPYEHDPNGAFLIEQVYVQYYIPADQRNELPLVLLHGGGLTGACWETTPDGRPGWLHDFLRQGFAVYVIDNVERGRSGFCAIEGIWDGAPVTRTQDQAWDLFRFGRKEDFPARKPYPGQRFPLAALENFQRQFVPRWTSTSEPQIAGVGAALRKIGPCVLLCHSQGGYIGSNAAVRNADVIKGFISAEGSGWPADELITLASVGGKPWLLLLGDFITDSERWTTAKAQTAAFGEKVKANGGTSELVELPDVGFPGATHMFMMDEHSAEISAWLGDWIRKNT